MRSTIANDALTEILKTGAKQLIHQAIQAELAVFMEQYSTRLTSDGKASVIRNGYQPEREILTGIGSISVKIPKVRTKEGRPVTFYSALVSPYARKIRSIESNYPWLYVNGITTGEMSEALRALVGNNIRMLSSNTIARLKQEWKQEYQQWQHRPLTQDQWVYIWADGICSGLRSENTRLYALVIIGVNERGQKHFLAVEDGVRESIHDWRKVLLKLKQRGMNAPKLAIGDGGLGFWKALAETYCTTSHQPCWAHKATNILNELPMFSQSNAKQALYEIW